MKRPAFQFYPADWRKDAAVQSCSIAARGLWHEMLCIMHECEPYGHLAVNGKAMQEPQLARLVGVTSKECTKLLTELEEAGVFSRTEEGCIHSRRMVRDEHLRNVRAEAGRLGGNPTLLNQKDKQKDKQAVNHTDNQSPTPSSSSSSSTSKPKTKKASADAPFVLPDWIPTGPWQAYLEMRNKKRKPATDYAKKLVVAELEKLRAAGHEPGAVLDRSTKAGWTDVYAVPAGASVSGKTLEQLIAEDPTYASE